eukprot:TRINITY_DN12191_c0_g1_i1.p1 TRINITY_DN12191_c0_g1~~TRINITY_DN12191_c0_g1_i1.p1  ORF type:complete len:485 (-),score=93.95 TRINITY_DN12191_c0_g1_i1:233-1654(-)
MNTVVTKKQTSPFFTRKASVLTRKRRTTKKAYSPSKRNSLGSPIQTRSASRSSPKKRSRRISEDRFIPRRCCKSLDLQHFKLLAGDEKEESDSLNLYNKSVAETLFEEDEVSAKVLSFDTVVEKDKSVVKKLRKYHVDVKGALSSKRKIASDPFKILDAPGLSDDYYLNLLDWNSDNILSVALHNSVYLWNAETAKVDHLLTLPGDATVSSISLVDGQMSNLMAIGTDDYEVQIWDINQKRKLRTLRGHVGRVSSLAWRENVLSTGSRDTMIFNNDIRIANPLISAFRNHTQEVVGLKWSPDGSQLASGGNDNLLNIWSASTGGLQYKFEEHQAAVKAVAWCPFKHNTLASGGGNADQTIRFWNTSTGKCMNVIDTKSQVCSLQWSKDMQELVSSHGFPQNQMVVWKYPTMEKVTELTGHESRVLHTALNPSGNIIASAAGNGDETIRFWKLYDLPECRSVKTSGSIEQMSIR